MIGKVHTQTARFWKSETGDATKILQIQNSGDSSDVHIEIYKELRFPLGSQYSEDAKNHWTSYQ